MQGCRNFCTFNAMILIIDDDKTVVKSISFLLKQHGYPTCFAYNPEESLLILNQQKINLVILDMNFNAEIDGHDGLTMLKKIRKNYPLIPVILITAWGHMALAIDGMKAGAVDFINKPWDNHYLVEAVQTALQLNQPMVDHAKDRILLDSKYQFGNIVGNDPGLVKILQLVGRVCNTSASILIMGESGTGKELVAEAIHQNSNRKEHPFVKVNLGGISSTLFESELFGHVKGAFTDACTNRAGRFEQAHRGTIFLDEIGELDLNGQVKLLRVLQERKFEVLGSNQTREVDIRVICATNKDLPELVSQGKFREDLLYRINLISFTIPPLRERREDIPLLIDFFLTNLKTIYQRPYLEITREAIGWLKELPYPGNIRELKNLVERTILVNDKKQLSVKEFKEQLDIHPAHQSTKGTGSMQLISLEEMEKKIIRQALVFYENNISEVARSLGISRAALYRRLEKYQIDYEN